jgi:hypothetical protein
VQLGEGLEECDNIEAEAVTVTKGVVITRDSGMSNSHF